MSRTPSADPSGFGPFTALPPPRGARRLLLSTPVGSLLAEYDDGAVRSVRFWEAGRDVPAGTGTEASRGDEVGWALAEQLREYFAGTRRRFDLPLSAEGTAFQRRVRAALRAIPFGEVRTYGQVAAELGAPGAVRAVGQANRRNPLPVIVPCHRVVAAGGIGGYAGSGPDGKSVDVKRWLLRHEGAAGW